MDYLTEEDKDRIHALRSNMNRTDAEDEELEKLEAKDKREEVPSGTTTTAHETDMRQEKAPK